MEIEFDPDKDASNLEKHGVSLARTGDVDVALVIESTRAADEERRFRLYGLLDARPHCAVITYRDGRVRAISLRRASRVERKRHELD